MPSTSSNEEAYKILNGFLYFPQLKQMVSIKEIHGLKVVNR